MPLKAIAQGITVTPGVIAGLDAGRLAKAYPVGSALANQDRLLRTGRRIVARWGIAGAGEWQIPSTNTTSASQSYPVYATERVVYRGKTTLTPGYQLKASVLCQPSGACQQLAAQWVPDAPPAGGRIVITAYLDNGSDTETVTKEITPPISKETYYGEPNAAGEAWSNIFREEVDLFPADIIEGDAALRWCKGDTVVTLTVSYYGGIRCMDGVVWEHFTGYLREWTDAEYVGHGYTNGQGQPLLKYPSSYPIQRREEATPDPTSGSRHALTVSTYQQACLGPAVVGWTAWDEVDVLVSATEAAGKVVAVAGSWEDAFDSSTVLPDPDAEGWSTAGAAHARGFNLSGDLLECRDDEGVIPVTVWVYGSCGGGVGSPGYVRAWCGDHSWVEVLVDSSSAGWFSASGELRCGVGAEADTTCHLMIQSDAADDVEVLYVTIEFDRARRVG